MNKNLWHYGKNIAPLTLQYYNKCENTATSSGCRWETLEICEERFGVKASRLKEVVCEKPVNSFGRNICGKIKRWVSQQICICARLWFRCTISFQLPRTCVHGCLTHAQKNAHTHTLACVSSHKYALPMQKKKNTHAASPLTQIHSQWPPTQIHIQFNRDDQALVCDECSICSPSHSAGTC